jgi:GDP-4-dehydro-6-deoxy-D-mannose reductase
LVRESEVPIKETNPLRPLSPYGVSKVSLDYLGYQYSQSYKMRIVRTRAFNHTGPRRGEVFVCSSFAKQIAQAEKGVKKPILLVGNLEAIRDFTDVRDMVRAYWLAISRGKPGEVYNIASGKGIKIADVLSMLVKMSKVRIEIKQDPARMRPSDVPILIGDSSKFRKATGWRPQISFKKTVKDILDYWRERIRKDEK